jgi:hypothetical protein
VVGEILMLPGPREVMPDFIPTDLVIRLDWPVTLHRLIRHPEDFMWAGGSDPVSSRHVTEFSLRRNFGTKFTH